MEHTLKNRKFTLREAPSDSFLNEFMPHNDWVVEVDGTAEVVTIAGIPSDRVVYNQTVRTLVWTNFKAKGHAIGSGVLSFNRDHTICHGTLTTAGGLSYVVQLVNEQDNDYYTSSPPPPYSAEDPEKDGLAENVKPVVDDDDPFKAYVKEMIASAGPEDEIPVGHKRRFGHGTEEQDMNKVSMTSFKMLKRPAGSGKFESFGTLEHGVAMNVASHNVVLWNDEDITNLVTISGDKWTKDCNALEDSKPVDPNTSADEVPDPFGFDITFDRSIPQLATFAGQYMTKDVKSGVITTFDIKGKDPSTKEIALKGSTSVPRKGTDGHSLDELLYGVTSLYQDQGASAPKDLAQEKADSTFDRLVMASVDSEISNMLFPNAYILNEAEKKLQALAPDFLPRAGVHVVLQHIKESAQVKQDVKNMINGEKCKEFIPACYTALQPKAGDYDHVVRYGADRVRDKAILEKLHTQVQNLTTACYYHGYKELVSSMGPFLANAGEWYDTLETVINDRVFLQDWTNKVRGSDGQAKALESLKTKLHLLYDEAQSKTEFKARLKPNIMTPTELVAKLNAVGLMQAMELAEWDEQARAHLRTMFENLDKREGTAADKALADEQRKLLLGEDHKTASIKALGEALISEAEKMRGDKYWTLKDANTALALAQADEATGGRNRFVQAAEGAAGAQKKTLASTAFGVIRGLFTVGSITALMVVITGSSSHMEWYEQLAIVGQLSQGFSAAIGDARALASSWQGGKEKARKAGEYFSKIMADHIVPFGRSVGKWLAEKAPKFGKEAIRQLQLFVESVKDSKEWKYLANLASKAKSGIRELATKVFKFLGFALSTLCMAIAVVDCIEAWKHGTTSDKVFSSIGAAIAGLEVISLVLLGVAKLQGNAVWMVRLSRFAMVLGAAGLVFAVVVLIYTFATAEDPIKKVVQKFGGQYGILV